MSNSFVTLWTVTPQLLCPWDSPGKDTGVGCHFLSQGIFPDPGMEASSPQLLMRSLPLSHQGTVSRFRGGGGGTQRGGRINLDSTLFRHESEVLVSLVSLPSGFLGSTLTEGPGREPPSWMQERLLQQPGLPRSWVLSPDPGTFTPCPACHPSAA